MTLSTSAGPWPITCERQIHEGRFALRFEPDRLQRNQQPRGFAADRQRLPEAFLAAYPTLCLNAATRLRTLYDPVDDPPEEERLACPGGAERCGAGATEDCGPRNAAVLVTRRPESSKP